MAKKGSILHKIKLFVALLLSAPHKNKKLKAFCAFRKTIDELKKIVKGKSEMNRLIKNFNKFNKVLISEQLAEIRLHKRGPRPEKGYIDYFYKNNNIPIDFIVQSGYYMYSGFLYTYLFWRTFYEQKSCKRSSGTYRLRLRFW